MKLIGAFDLDEVILQTHKVWIKEYNKFSDKHGHPITTRSDINNFDFFPNLCETCYARNYHNSELALSLEIYPDARDEIPKLRQHLEKMYIVTHRPDDIRSATLDNLYTHGILDSFDDIIVTEKPKRDVCLDLGATFLVDDKPDTIRSLENTSCIPILFSASWNKEETGVVRVSSLREVRKFIELITQSNITMYQWTRCA